MWWYNEILKMAINLLCISNWIIYVCIQVKLTAVAARKNVLEKYSKLKVINISTSTASNAQVSLIKLKLYYYSNLFITPYSILTSILKYAWNSLSIVLNVKKKLNWCKLFKKTAIGI